MSHGHSNFVSLICYNLNLILEIKCEHSIHMFISYHSLSEKYQFLVMVIENRNVQ